MFPGSKTFAVLSLLAGLSTLARAQTSPAPATPPANFKFSFGTKPAPGYTLVPATARYSDRVGYGFENIGGVFPTSVPVTSPDALHSGYITGVAPPAAASNAVFFSVKLPAGNYRVTVTLGGAAAPTQTTVRAELRRLMLERVPAPPGEFVTRTFAVNVRQPPILDAAGKQLGTVKLSAREAAAGTATQTAPRTVAPNLLRTQGGEGWAWDDTLTLEFVGPFALCALDIQRDDAIKTIFLCGDSTVCDQPAEPYASWGQVITRWFQPDVAVANYALSGNTAAAFYSANRMAKILSLLRPGDYVFVQYGHNDMKNTAANALASYQDYYARFVADTRGKGATPVLLTPVSRKSFGPDGKITNSFLTTRGDDFPLAVRQVARDKDAFLIDLQARSATFYETIGRDKIQPAFATASESTHHSDYGSYEIARCVVQGIVDLKLPLAKSLTDDWTPYDPAKPALPANYKIPPDPPPAAPATAPAGN